MTSKLETIKHLKSVFVWVWLPHETEPVVAGQLMQQKEQYAFVYGKSYREREGAIPLSPLELPLSDEVFLPTGMRNMPSCVRDALPDAWGRRLMDYQYAPFHPNELDYGLLSGSNRIGALDFQHSATEYVARELGNVNLHSIEKLAIALEKDRQFSQALAPILLHGTSVGGARPKCLLTIDGIETLTKFSLSTDYYPFLRAEFIAMRLAKLAGLDVAEVKLATLEGRDILLIKRFDRCYHRNKITRKMMLSGLSLLGLDAMEARYASYRELADVIRTHFIEPKKQLRELFSRIAFNVLMGNTDDHARNHSAFWDGISLQLTPAYDICPQLRTGFEATQAMMIEGELGQSSTLKNVLSAHDYFLLVESEAKDIINHQIHMLDKHWSALCAEAKLAKKEQARLWGSVIKSEYCLYGW